VAGHETTASALGFVLYVLGKYPHVQQKLVEEIESVCGMDKTPTYEQLNSMEYLYDIIRETMRLYSPVGGVTPKIAAEDTEICGYHIPKGTLINMSLWSVHHSEVYYGPTVNEFRPERWQGEEGKKIHKFAHVPFSAGARVCIGNNFSLVEQKLFLIKLLQVSSKKIMLAN
jgi:cytochrome P450